MNSSMIRYILGHVLKIEGVLMFLPVICSLIYKDAIGYYFFTTALLCIVLGFFMTMRKPKSDVFYLKEGCVTTALSWMFLSFFGAIPFWASGEIPSLTNALFETISGFTTTGASILNNVEGLSHSALFWRSFTHWIGGMGVLVFLLAIIPLTGGSNINLMRAESPGPSVGKLVPKVKQTASILYMIYFVLTVIEFLFLMAGHMPLFDSICTAVGTAGTGGFGIKNDSFGSYSPYLQWVVTVFMILFGINFNAYFFIIFGQIKKAFCMEEVRYYLGLVLATIGIITFNLRHIYTNVGDALRHASFQVASLISSTGFSSTDFDLWPETSKTLLVLIMFVGACAGSTGGGIKVSRIVILLKTLHKELNSYIHPKSIKKIKFEDKPVEHEVVRSTNVYFLSFMIVYAISLFCLSFDGFDFTTNFTSVIATLNNIGPGLEQVGPAQNFDLYSNFSKFVLMFDMLAGRLELFPMLIFLYPAVWKDLFISQRRRRKLEKK